MLDVFYASFEAFARACAECGYDPKQLLENGTYLEWEGKIYAKEYYFDEDFQGPVNPV